jgi:hypothetical protein
MNTCDGGHICPCCLAIVYIFVCGLFRDGVSSSDYISLHIKIVSELPKKKKATFVSYLEVPREIRGNF